MYICYLLGKKKLKNVLKTVSRQSDRMAAASPNPAISGGAAQQILATHAFMLKDCKFVLDTKYTPQKILGRGIFEPFNILVFFL